MPGFMAPCSGSVPVPLGLLRPSDSPRIGIPRSLEKKFQADAIKIYRVVDKLNGNGSYEDECFETLQEAKRGCLIDRKHEFMIQSEYWAKSTWNSYQDSAGYDEDDEAGDADYPSDDEGYSEFGLDDCGGMIHD
jgi:hypothetical protein